MGYICILSQMKSKFNLDKWRCSLYIGISIAKKRKQLYKFRKEGAAGNEKAAKITMKHRSNIHTDIVIVGSGVAGLFAALCLPESKKILMITKEDLKECDSYLAQGGVCVLKSLDDFKCFYEDTMKAGHYENNPESVRVMIESSPDVIGTLIKLGADFDTKKDGDFDYTREGAHRNNRILHHKDETGKEITTTLLSIAKNRRNITFIPQTTMIDLIERDNTCYGIVCEDEFGERGCILAQDIILATGGIGGLFKSSTNYPHITGDSFALAIKHGVALQDMSYIQIHPTTLYSKKSGRRFLISESVRGEGAILLNENGERFTDELQPRDVVAAAIREQMKQDGTEHEWLSFAPVERDVVTGHFANIRARCLEDGRDILDEPIPVTPTQHYFMGGVWVDKDGRTSMPELYAAGETACNGVHGKNRLASNSLLEALVWGRRAAWYMRTGESLAVEQAGDPALDGRHRALSADILAIDDLARAAGTQAVEE